jgi:hypothetical protein
MPGKIAIRRWFPPVVAIALAGAAASAQDGPGSLIARPMFAVLPATRARALEAAPGPAAEAPLPSWKASCVAGGQTYAFTMVGAAPSKNGTTTIPAVIIPVTIVVTNGTTQTAFSPAHVLPNGKTVIENSIASPIFDSTTVYIQGGINLGATQYIDAFQRGNFLDSGDNPSYHLLLSGPLVKEERTLSPSSGRAQTADIFGIEAAAADLYWFDEKAQSFLKTLNIPPNVLPIFLTYDTCLGEGGLPGCCIGGYHSAVVNSNGTIACVEATYADKPGAFAQDVSARSHEIAEWAEDPFTNNPTPCGEHQLLEAGDPEEGFPNYGAFPYPVNGFSYNLQDLVFLPYFGAKANRSVNGWMSFQGNPFGLTVCSNGG